MKSILLSILCVNFFVSIYAQTAVEIIEASRQKCLTVNSGSLVVQTSKKVLTSADTFNYTHEVDFVKLPEDKIYKSAFYNRMYDKDSKLLRVNMYDGVHYTSCSTRDSSAMVLSVLEKTDEIKNQAANNIIYSLLMNPSAFPFPKAGGLDVNEYSISTLEETILDGKPVYYISLNKKNVNEIGGMLKVLSMQYKFWISKLDFIPYQFAETLQVLMGKDTLSQFNKYALKKYDFNVLHDIASFSPVNIPKGYELRETGGFKKQDLLLKGAIAPLFKVTDLSGNLVKLKNYAGKVVLLDFFYKSCYPCLLSIPTMNRLYKKYHNQGLEILGLDIYDKDVNELSMFLKNQGVEHTIALCEKEISASYQVSAYPTFYLINKEGKIVYAKIGYNDNLENVLEELIKANL